MKNFGLFFSNWIIRVINLVPLSLVVCKTIEFGTKVDSKG